MAAGNQPPLVLFFVGGLRPLDQLQQRRQEFAATQHYPLLESGCGDDSAAYNRRLSFLSRVYGWLRFASLRLSQPTYASSL